MMKRNSTIEIMRIGCIFLIILSHFMEKSYLAEGVCFLNAPFQKNTIGANLIGIWGVGGCGFIAISSYYMSDSIKSNQLGKAFEIGFKAWLYSIFFFVLSFLVFQELNLKLFIKEILTPFYTRQYWYVSAYCVFAAFVPLLNGTLKKMSRKNLKVVCGVLLGIRIQALFFENIVGSVSIFICVYYWVNYLKRYPDSRFLKYNNFILVSAVVMKYFSIVVCNWIGTLLNNNILLNFTYQLKGCNNPLDLIIGVVLLFVLVNVKSGSNKIVYAFARTTFGIYLIQSNLLCIEGSDSLLFHRIFHIQDYVTSPIYTLYVMVFSLICLFVCSMLSFLIDTFWVGGIMRCGLVKRIQFYLEKME